MLLTGPAQLEDWMRRRGFTQADAARFLEEEESWIHRVRTGKDLPGLRKAVKIQQRAGIPCEAWVTEPAADEIESAANGRKRRLAKEKA